MYVQYFNQLLLIAIISSLSYGVAKGVANVQITIWSLSTVKIYNKSLQPYIYIYIYIHTRTLIDYTYATIITITYVGTV